MAPLNNLKYVPCHPCHPVAARQTLRILCLPYDRPQNFLECVTVILRQATKFFQNQIFFYRREDGLDQRGFEQSGLLPAFYCGLSSFAAMEGGDAHEIRLFSVLCVGKGCCAMDNFFLTGKASLIIH